MAVKNEDEGVWILEGSATLHVGDEVIEVSAGDFVWRPRDIPHRYSVGQEVFRMLFLCTPAGFENLVREMRSPAETRTLPPASDEPPHMEMVAAVAQRNGCELLAGADLGLTARARQALPRSWQSSACRITHSKGSSGIGPRLLRERYEPGSSTRWRTATSSRSWRRLASASGRSRNWAAEVFIRIRSSGCAISRLMPGTSTGIARVRRSS
jgi:hypothetical protein